MVILTVACLLAFVVCPGLAPGSRTASRRSVCKSTLKQILIALHNYHEMYDSFPPAYVSDKNGRPMHSWRVLLLPFLEAPHLYKQYRFNEPWNSPHNSKLASQMPGVFACPSVTDGDAMTRYVPVRDPGSLFPGTQTRDLRDISDGSVNTIAVVETTGRPVHWMAPDDVAPEDFLRTIVERQHHQGGTHIALADGSVRFVPSETPATTIRALISIAGREDVPQY